MCTSFTATAADGSYFLARTMDFAFPLNGRPVALPRNYRWQGTVSGTEYVNKFGMIGTSRPLHDTYFVADAVNEKGLCGACLYFPGYAQYGRVDTATTSLVPHEVVSYLVGNCEDLHAVREAVATIEVIEAPIPVLGIMPPLHWIFTDASGEVLVIESEKGKLICKDNPVGVMTNAPELEWHLTNLSNYLGLSAEPHAPKEFSKDFSAKPLGSGTGSLALPGGYTPPQRFVRAAFLRSTMPELKNQHDAIVEILHVLHSFDLPRGAVKDGVHDHYTQYSAILCGKSASMVFVDYDSLIPFEAKVSDFSEITEPVEFKIPQLSLS